MCGGSGRTCYFNPMCMKRCGKRGVVEANLAFSLIAAASVDIKPTGRFPKRAVSEHRCAILLLRVGTPVLGHRQTTPSLTSSARLAHHRVSGAMSGGGWLQTAQVSVPMFMVNFVLFDPCAWPKRATSVDPFVVSPESAKALLERPEP